jgi:DNA mismatch repair ATPase MutS
MKAKEFYTAQTKQLHEQQKKLLQKKNNFAWLRLGNMLAIIAALYFLYPLGWAYSIMAALVLAFIFVQLIYKDLANKEAIAHSTQLLLINEGELKALDHQYFHFADGTEHIPKEHFYANDMDIFGHASLFQFLNRSVSEMGSRQLAEWLLQPAAPEEIPGRQEAIKELSSKMLWNQRLLAHGKENPIKLRTKEILQYWLYEPDSFGSFKPWQWLCYALPAVSVGVTIATIFSFLPLNVFYVTMLMMAVTALPLEKKIGKLHNRLSKMLDELQTLSRSIETIEGENFQSPLLRQLQHQYLQEQTSASRKIKEVKKILDRLDIRFNIVLAIPLNLLLLWNLQQMLRLEKWKKENSADVSHWFDTLGSYEALISLTVIHFNNPAWVFPTLREDYFYIEAQEMGHPLIAATKRVNNFIRVDHKASVMLVTGSNMAGKSTYLRSTGINVILAMAGAPVCATQFVLSPVQLISSMRISDNLEESTSTFYAELKKLKTVIDKVNNHEKVFILLDEILRGTNSLDRHTGSEALIKQLIKQDAAAILATHDLDLASLQEIYPGNIFNFHFDVQVNKEELYFDYQLKPGVCNSLNASILMKKIGLEL